MKNQSNSRMQNTIMRMCVIVLFFSLIGGTEIFAQHQHGGGGMGGNQNMQMHAMQKQMEEMQNMMTKMNGLVSKSSMMVSMMKNGDQMQQQSANSVDMHSKMLPLMQNMENIAKSMDGTLSELNKMMGDKGMMQNEAMSDHIKDMMGKMESLMDDYDDMLKLMKDAQEKGYK